MPLLHSWVVHTRPCQVSTGSGWQQLGRVHGVLPEDLGAQGCCGMHVVLHLESTVSGGKYLACMRARVHTPVLGVGGACRHKAQ